MKKLFLQIFLFFLLGNAYANTTVIVPFSAGGAFDKMAREFSFFVKSKTGENLIVENRLGAGSVVGTQTFLSSTQPNNSLLITSSSFFVNIAEERFKKEDFRLVSILGISPYVLVTANSSNLSCESLKDRNRKFFVGTAGKGSASDTAAEILMRKYDNITLVHYKGISHVLTDLIPGRVDFTFTTGLKDKDVVKMLATTTTNNFYKGMTNWKSCLDLNTDYYGEFVVAAHASASEEFVKRINDLALEFVRNPEVIEKLTRDGVQPLSHDLKRLNTYYSESLDNWKKLLKKN